MTWMTRRTSFSCLCSSQSENETRTKSLLTTGRVWYRSELDIHASSRIKSVCRTSPPCYTVKTFNRTIIHIKQRLSSRVEKMLIIISMPARLWRKKAKKHFSLTHGQRFGGDVPTPQHIFFRFSFVTLLLFLFTSFATSGASLSLHSTWASSEKQKKFQVAPAIIEAKKEIFRKLFSSLGES